MRLEPVFVVAPKPKPPSMPTRRAFLFAGGTFCIGAALGGACGYSIGAAAAKPTPAESELPKSGNAELDELRRLAVKAPIEELVEKRLVFVNCLTTTYPTDKTLWVGIRRLADAVIETTAFPDRRISAHLLAQVIERAEPDLRSEFGAKLLLLKDVR